MKLTKLLSLLLALMMVFTFVGCASDSDKDDDDDKKTSASDLSDEELIIGKWVVEFNNEELAELYGAEVEDLEAEGIDGMLMSMEFDEDGKVLAYMEMGEETDEDESEYELKDGDIYIDGEGQPYKFDGADTLIIEISGVEYEFKRDGEVKKPSKNNSSNKKPAKKDDEELIIGKWVAEFDKEATAELLGATVEDLEAEDIDGMLMSMNFKKSGTVVTYMEMGENSNEDELDYEIKDGKIYIDGDGQAYEFDGEDTLIVDFDGMDVEFERQ